MILLSGLVFLSWWSLLFSQEWWGHILYGVYGFLAFAAGGTGRIQIFGP
jgi:hypothetical protein